MQHLIAQSCLTLCDTMDCSSPGSSVRGDSPGKNTRVGCHFLLQGLFPTQGAACPSSSLDDTAFLLGPQSRGSTLHWLHAAARVFLPISRVWEAPPPSASAMVSIKRRELFQSYLQSAWSFVGWRDGRGREGSSVGEMQMISAQERPGSHR